MSTIVIGPSRLSIIVPSALKPAAEAWLNGLIPGGFTFVAQLAASDTPTLLEAWHAGVSVSDDIMALIASSADTYGVGYLVLERYEGIDTQDTDQMTLKRVTNKTTHLAALGLVPREQLL